MGPFTWPDWLDLLVEGGQMAKGVRAFSLDTEVLGMLDKKSKTLKASGKSVSRYVNELLAADLHHSDKARS